MATRKVIQVGTKTVRPVLSMNEREARSRVLNLYKAWYRQIPYIVKEYDIPKSETQCREKLKELFMNNKDVTDIRVIDLLIIKGQMELKESVKMWKQKGHVMMYFKPTVEPKPKDFLSKFLSGQRAMKAASKVVRPVVSLDCCEAHRRVMGLYRAAYRYIPYIVKYYDIPKDEQACRWKLRELFYRNAFVTDIRVIDILVLKGFMELKEITHSWQQKGHVMNNWHPSIDPKPCSFLGKFLSGMD